MGSVYLDFDQHVADVRSLIRASGAAFSDQEIGDYLQRALDEYSRCVPYVQNCVFEVEIDGNNVNLDSDESAQGDCPISIVAVIGAEYQDRTPIENCQQIIYNHDVRQLYFGPDVKFTKTQVVVRYRARWLVRKDGDDYDAIDPYPQAHRGIINRLAAALALEAKHADTMGAVASCVTCESQTVTTQTGTTTTETTSVYGKVSTTDNDLTDMTVYNSDQTRTDDLRARTVLADTQTRTDDLRAQMILADTQTRTDNLLATTNYGGINTTDYGRSETLGGTDETASTFSETLTRTNDTLIDADNPTITEHSVLPYKVEHHSNKIAMGFCCSDFTLNITAASVSIPIPAIHFEGTDPGAGTLSINIPAITFSTPLGDITTPEIDWSLPSPYSIDLPNYDLYPLGPTLISEHFKEYNVNTGHTTCTENLSAHNTSETQTTDYGRTTNMGGTDVSTQSGSDSVAQTGTQVTARTGEDNTYNTGTQVTARTGEDNTYNTGTQVTARRGDDTTLHTGTQVTTQSGQDVVTSVTTNNLTTSVLDPNKNMLTLLMLADRYFQMWQKLWNDAWRDLQCICEQCNNNNQLQPNANGYNAQQIFGRSG